MAELLGTNINGDLVVTGSTTINIGNDGVIKINKGNTTIIEISKEGVVTLKNNAKLASTITFKDNNNHEKIYDGNASIDINYGDVGALPDTIKYAGSSSKGGAADSVANYLTFSTDGKGNTDKYNGSTAKKISWNSIGALPNTTTYVSSIKEGTRNGAIGVSTKGGDAVNVDIKGLASAAYKTAGSAIGNLPEIGAALGTTANVPVLVNASGKLIPGTAAIGDAAYRETNNDEGKLVAENSSATLYQLTLTKSLELNSNAHINLNGAKIYKDKTSETQIFSYNENEGVLTINY